MVVVGGGVVDVVAAVDVVELVVGAVVVGAVVVDSRTRTVVVAGGAQSSLPGCPSCPD